MRAEELVKKQREYFESGVTLTYTFRLAALGRRHDALERYEKKLCNALYQDLHKSVSESCMAEICMTRMELTHCTKRLARWMRQEYVKTKLANFPAKQLYDCRAVRCDACDGAVELSGAPVSGTADQCNCCGKLRYFKTIRIRAACVFHSGRNDRRLICAQHIAVVEGGREENNELLEQRFDHIFFTGSTTVGKIVLEKAARYVTPVTLELGGKSPCIVDKTADIKIAARRIMFGKILNSGQTCVAPDYLVVHREVKEALLAAMKEEITAMLGENPLEAEEYPRMVNEKHYRRVMGLIQGEKVIVGGMGNPETLQIAPTILDEVSLDAPVMQEEIFGPVLPVLTFETREELLPLIRHFEKPLACYVFTTDRRMERWVISRISFGGGCVNDTIMHLASSEMGFGGVGASGMGNYHGKHGFETFSHRKSVLKKYNWLDLPMRYHPYEKWKDDIIRKVME